MSTSEQRHESIPILFWIGLGCFVMFFSCKLGLGRLHNPGPGFVPFLLGLLLSIVSAFFLVGTIRSKKEPQPMGQPESGADAAGHVNLVKLGTVLATLFAYSLLFETLGYLIATLLMSIILFRTMGLKWPMALLAAALTAFLSYFLFTSLGVLFPKGILKGL